eukprot:6455829-Amphidinium_carterae.1
MLSGRSTVVAAYDYDDVKYVLAECRRRLGLTDDGRTMEIWHGWDRVPVVGCVRYWPGVQPRGEISEYQLVVRA